uniref:FCH domain-containing protein n=1 Tax=Timema monikensis TaxID=170555 RepID=A0A7R9HPW1_9NEOP|nr:unnamed protein product [Timema monikensis]
MLIAHTASNTYSKGGNSTHNNSAFGISKARLSSPLPLWLVACADCLPSLHSIIVVLLFSADIRVQLTEQLRCLDVRMESQVALVAELQDYFRRRAEVELDYSKNLDKLAKSLQLRHKEQRQNPSLGGADRRRYTSPKTQRPETLEVLGSVLSS